MGEEFVKEKSNRIGIELNFDGEQPGAVDYFKMAMKESENLKNSMNEPMNEEEEAENDNNDIDKNALVQQLFEKAIATFETEWKEAQEKNADVTTQRDLLIQYMDCLKEFSLWTKYTGSIDDAEKLGEEWLKKNDNEGYVWITLANIRLIKMNILCESENDAEKLDENEEEEEEEEEEVEEVEEVEEDKKGKGKAVTKVKEFIDNELPEKDKKALENIKSSIEKGFALLEKEKEQNKKLISDLYIIIANSYYNYGLSQRDSSSKRQCTACIKECFSFVIEYINNAMEINKSAFEKDDWVQALPGFAYYYLADLYSKKYENTEEAMDYVMEAIEIVMTAEELAKKNSKIIERAKYLEMIGQSYLLLSTMTDTDEDTIGAYDNAIDAMKASIKLNPNNHELLNLMMEIGALNMNEDGTYVLTEDDGHGCGCGGYDNCDGNCEGCGGCGGNDHEEVDEEEIEALEEEAGGCCGGGCCGGCCGGIKEDTTTTKRKTENEENPAKFMKKNDGEKCCGGDCCQK